MPRPEYLITGESLTLQQIEDAGRQPETLVPAAAVPGDHDLGLARVTL